MGARFQYALAGAIIFSGAVFCFPALRSIFVPLYRLVNAVTLGLLETALQNLQLANPVAAGMTLVLIGNCIIGGAAGLAIHFLTHRHRTAEK